MHAWCNSCLPALSLQSDNARFRTRLADNRRDCRRVNNSSNNHKGDNESPGASTAGTDGENDDFCIGDDVTDVQDAQCGEIDDETSFDFNDGYDYPEEMVKIKDFVASKTNNPAWYVPEKVNVWVNY